VNAIASSDYQPKGVWEGRAAHGTAKATDNILARFILEWSPSEEFFRST
jgi:hypothetical protein